MIDRKTIKEVNLEVRRGEKVFKWGNRWYFDQGDAPKGAKNATVIQVNRKTYTLYLSE
jgi:hypothetical protein